MKGRKTLRDYISNIPRGIKKAIAVGTLLGMVSFAPLPAVHANEIYSKQNEDGWKVELGVDAVPFILQTQGLEEEMGKSGEIYDEWSYDYSFDYSNWENWQEKWNEKENYGSQLNSIIGDPGAQAKTLIKPKASLYTPSGVGFHVGGWMLSGSDSRSGKVPGFYFEFESESDSDPGLYTYQEEYKYSLGLVSMWDEIFGSFWGEYKGTWTYDPNYGWYDWTFEEKYYPEKAKTKYETSRDFKIIDANLFMSIPVVPSLSALAGLRGQLFEINDMQRVQPIYHSEGTYIDNYLDGSKYISKYIWNNNIDLKVDSSAKSLGIGPMVGLSAMKNITKWLRAYGEISKSWIRMKTERTANFLDIDDITENGTFSSYDSEGNLIYEDTLEGRAYWEGKFPFSDTRTYNVPLTEINLGLDFLLGKNVTLSGGYWKQMMQNVPKPARFHYKQIEEMNDYNKLWEYEIEAKDISAEGFKVGVGVRF